jgi:hypothetical protein
MVSEDKEQDKTIEQTAARMADLAQEPSRDTGRKDHKRWFVRLAVNLCRFVLGVVFVFSGYVKAIDPLGTQYKIQDYLAALGLQGVVPDVVTLGSSVLLSAFEFSLGIFILFAIRRRLVSKLLLLLMIFMMAISVWVAVANPVKDCGCFGDAVVLTNAETLLKNIVLLACAVVLWKWPLGMYRFISRSNQWIAINFTVLFIIVTSVYCLYKLPIFDFRPYHVGVNILKGMEIPEGAEQPQFETTFVMEKNGERREFSLENYPDSTWQFIDSKTVQTAKGYVPPIHDFSIQLAEGDDITEELLSRKGYLFLLISPHLSNASDTNFGDIDQIYEYAQQEKVPFYCLTASTEAEIEHWENITGAEYPFCMTDETTLKTMIRSNPGLLLLKDGTIIRKWSHNALPKGHELSAPLSELEIGRMPGDTVAKTITQVVLWFFLPLLLLTLADRMWAWSQYLRRRTRLPKIGNTSDDEKES